MDKDKLTQYLEGAVYLTGSSESNISSFRKDNSKIYEEVKKICEEKGYNLGLVFAKAGLNPGKIRNIKTIEDILEWANVFDIKDKKTNQISGKNLNSLINFSKKLGMDLEEICCQLNLEIPQKERDVYLKKVRKYNSITEIKEDIKEKGLLGKSPGEIEKYDNHKTFKNILEFSKRHNLSISDIWNVVGIKYTENYEIENGEVKRKNKYKTVEDIKDDLENKGLVGKSPIDIEKHDNHKTYTNIIRFAKNNDLPIKEIWDDIGIIPSMRSKHDSQIIYETIEDIRSDLEDKDLIGKRPIDVRKHDDRLTEKKIRNFARKNELDIREVWEHSGIVYDKKTKGVYQNLDQIKSDLEDKGLLRKRPIDIKRYKNREIYSNILSFAKREKLKLKDLWRNLGISYQWK
jgi:hypothetical protein